MFFCLFQVSLLYNCLLVVIKIMVRKHRHFFFFILRMPEFPNGLVIFDIFITYAKVLVLCEMRLFEFSSNLKRFCPFVGISISQAVSSVFTRYRTKVSNE